MKPPRIVAENLCVRTSFVWTEGEYLRSMQHHDERITRSLSITPPVTAMMSIVAVLVLAICWWVLIRSGFASSEWPHALGSLAFAAYWLGAVQLKTWWQRRYFRQQIGANSQVRWEFSGRQIKFEGAFAKSESEWKALSRILEASDGFLLYTYPKNMFFWQPFSAFASLEDIEAFRQLAQASQVPYAKTAS